MKRLVLLCQAAAPPPHDREVVAKALCIRAAALASKSAPVPVEIVALGDPALRAGSSVALIIQGAVVEVAPRDFRLVVAARTDHRAMMHPDESYFGATPGIAPFTSAAEPAPWDAALAASINELLPWRQGEGR